VPKLKCLSGEEIITILIKFGFKVHSQRGSHIKLKRIAGSGDVQTLTIPRHQELDKGTLRAIFRQASRFIQEDELRKEFYS